MDVLAVIPARLGSTRLPRKPLADIGGHPMIEWVYRAASRSRSVSRVLVATDSDEVAEAVRAFGGDVCITSPAHPSGTDRMAEVARAFPAYPVLLNVQGDEPLLEPGPLDLLVGGFLADSEAQAGTLVRPAVSAEEVASPSTAKVVLRRDGSALYFSRSPIPFDRDGSEDLRRWIHIGVYIYRREFLMQYAVLEPGPLERAEKLEQLRVLEHGYRMATVPCDVQVRGVDTPADLETVRALVAARRLMPA